MMIISDAQSIGVTYDYHSDDSRGVIYGTGITHDNCHLRSSYFYSTGQWKNGPHLLVKNHFAEEIRIRKAKAVMKLMENENFIIVFLKKSVAYIIKILQS
jgi:hypothetical protein